MIDSYEIGGTHTMWEMHCDEPGCSHKSTDVKASFQLPKELFINAESAGWSVDGDFHFCPQHIKQEGYASMKDYEESQNV